MVGWGNPSFSVYPANLPSFSRLSPARVPSHRLPAPILADPPDRVVEQAVAVVKLVNAPAW